MRRFMSLSLAAIMTVGLMAGAVSVSADDYVPTISETIADECKMIGTDPTNLDPFYGNKSGKNIFFQVYQRLYGMDANGQLYGTLAKDYEVDDTGLVYTVHLYDGITDQEGRPFTASDVVFSYKTWKEEGFSKNIPKLDIDTGIVAIDDTTVQFTFSEPITEYNELFYYFGQNDLTTQAAYEASPSQLASDACGTGPYRITEYTPGVSVVFERWDDYWQKDESVIEAAQMANVRKITYYFISENEQKAVAIQTGTADVCTDMNYDAAMDFEDGGIYDDGFAVYKFWDNDVNAMFFNCSDESVMADKNLRLAVGYAINSDVITACLGDGVGQTIYGLGGSYYSDYDAEYWADRDDYEHNYDVEKAKELIAASNYNGETIKIMCNTSDRGGVRKTMCEVIGSFFDEVGLKYEILALDSTTEKTYRDELDKWDIDVLGMNANDSVVNVWYAKFDYSMSTTGDMTWFGLVDDEMISLLKTARNKDTYSEEAINAFSEYVIDNAYAYSLNELWKCVVYNSDLIDGVANSGAQSQILAGCMSYVE